MSTPDHPDSHAASIQDCGDDVPRISQRQLDANRRNAQRSSGPKTEAGQARSGFNGLKHGLYARSVVLPGEDAEAFAALLDNLKAELKPEGRAEHGMVSRAADIWWRLGRTAAIEAGFLSPDWSDDPRAGRFATGGGPLVDGFRVALGDTKTLDQLGRYEARLERALKRTFELLFQMQARRRLLLSVKNKKSRAKTRAKTPKKSEPKNSED